MDLDERRVMQMKSKTFQLERQVQQLIAASDLRAEMMNEVENYAIQLQEMASEEIINPNVSDECYQ